MTEEKYVLVRSFPGPVGSPIINVGGLSTPQLPQHYPYDNPTDNTAVQQAIKDLYQFPLAVYLCAFAGEKVYYTYSVWYDVRQHVPGQSLHDGGTVFLSQCEQGDQTQNKVSGRQILMNI